FRIDMHRTNLDDGTIHGSRTLEASDLFALSDRVSEQVAEDLGRRPARSPIASVTGTSLVARRFYEEGFSLYSEGNAAGGLALLERAMKEDSTFTMAAFYAARLAQLVRGDTAALRLMAHARALARTAPERQRLLVETAWAWLSNDRAWIPLAE